jgi:formylmethanofuran dehydrogenase subunit E
MAILLPVVVLSALAGGPDKAAAECLDRVREYHGAIDPWAVAGCRIGRRALQELGLPRHSGRLRVVWRCPAVSPYAAVADGLQAATGASPGKLTLKLEPAPLARMAAVVQDRKTGRTLTFTLLPAFVQALIAAGKDKREAQGRRAAALAEGEIFRSDETSPALGK